jgi:hypothetical protein
MCRFSPYAYVIMASTLRILLFLSLAGLAGWVSYNTYNYIFDTSKPIILIHGLCPGEHYAGDIPCVIESSDQYKVGSLSLWMDGKPIVTNHAVGRCACEYPFPIATRNLPNGSHTLKIVAIDGSYARNKTAEELVFVVDNTPLHAVLLKSENPLRVFQGRTLHVQFQINKEIKEAQASAFSRTFPCIKESPRSTVYECFIPVSSDEVPSEYLLSIDITDHVGNVTTLENKFHVVAYPFKNQHISVQSEKFKKEQEIGVSEEQFEEDIARATAASPAEKLWQGVFFAPCDITGVSTDFGVLRTTHERGKYRHNAVDLLGKPRSSVWACQDGRVVIKERYAHSGNTIVLDHGNGILSMYFHLEECGPCEVGDIVKKGKPVGTLGMTGYATGYHLHWEIRVMNVPVDPMQWTKQDF